MKTNDSMKIWKAIRNDSLQCEIKKDNKNMFILTYNKKM